jgi:hypothetical protein
MSAAPLGRRALLKSGTLTIACLVAGKIARISPAEAHELAAAPQVLTPYQAEMLGHFAETLVPGARAAGIAEYVDSQLAAEPTESLLIARYFGVVPPFRDFYVAGLASLDAAAKAANRQPFAKLAPGAALSLSASLLVGPPSAWSTPPPSLFYLAMRGDAVDVVYGTQAGFAALDVPYMEHILPPRRW